MSLTETAVSGGAWRGLSVFGGAAMQFAVSIVLARLLTPNDFGTVALVSVVVGLANTVVVLAIEPAVVQRKDLTQDHITAAWSLSLVGGLSACVLVAAASGVLARLVGDPSTAGLFAALSPTIALTGIRSCSTGLLRRHMLFRRLLVVDLASYATGYALVAIPAAAAGLGAWALALALLIQGAVATALALTLSHHSMRIGFPRGAVRDVLRFGGGMAVGGMANYVALFGDNFVVGRALGPAALGLYTRAYYLMNLPLSYLTQVLSQVLLPTYSRAQDDRDRMTRGYLTSVYLVFTLAVPAMMAMIVAAPYVLTGLFGPQWKGATLPLEILAAFGGLRAAYALGGSIAQASGRPWSEARRQLLYACLVVGGALAGSRWGIAGVACGTGIAIAVMYVAMARLTHSLLSFRWSAFAAAHRAGLAAGFSVLLIGLPVRLLLADSGTADILILVVLLSVCAAVSVLALRLTPRSWRPEGADRALSVAVEMAPAPLAKTISLVFGTSGPTVSAPES